MGISGENHGNISKNDGKMMGTWENDGKISWEDLNFWESRKRKRVDFFERQSSR